MIRKKKIRKPSRNAPLIQIGASPVTIKEARAAINDILKAPHADRETKIEALRSLATVCNVNGTVINNSNING